MSFVYGIYDLTLVAAMFWAVWRIYCVFMDEWITSRPIYSTFNIGEDRLNNGKWGVYHVWDSCICGCDPDWHYLDSRALLCCSNCTREDDGSYTRKEEES